MAKNKKIKNEAILVCLVLLFAFLFYVVGRTHVQIQQPNGTVDIFINGKLHQTLPIIENQTHTIENGHYKNIIQFTKDGVKMIYSNCTNQLCIQQGEVTFSNFAKRSMLNNIICLPHAVVVRLNVEHQEKDTPDF